MAEKRREIRMAEAAYIEYVQIPNKKNQVGDWEITDKIFKIHLYIPLKKLSVCIMFNISRFSNMSPT